jgi:hypothetical protein
VTTDGELTILLAMRWELPYQIRVELPGVENQETLTGLGRKFKVLWEEPRVSSVTSDGKSRLAVLGPDLIQELLDDPAQWQELADTEDPLSAKAR